MILNSDSDQCIWSKKARKLLEMESAAGPVGHGMAAGSKKAMPRMGISSGAIHPNLQHLKVTDNLLNLTERSSLGLLPAQALQVTVGTVQQCTYITEITICCM